MALLLYMFALFIAIWVVPFALFPFAFRMAGRLIGGSLKSKTQQRKELLLSRAVSEEKEQSQKQSEPGENSSSSTSLDEDWEQVNDGGNKTPTTSSAPQSKTTATSADHDFDGVIGFFHPSCNAGGGGERVLFAAIHATQSRYPNALCVVYTGDHDASRDQILLNVRNRFNIRLNSAKICFLYLTTREWVLASTWPHFTLLGQSLGSLVLGWDAFNLLAPDIFIDTVGYAFTLALSKWLFPTVPTGAYVHYPTISTDMLASLHDEVSTGRGLNVGLGKQGLKGKAKQIYWKLFAHLYSWVGGQVDVVMTNSSWTQNHIFSLWEPSRRKRGKKYPISVVYPPCAVEELREKIPVDAMTSKQRAPNILYIAQFRPEKMHTLIIDAFSLFLKNTAHLYADQDISKPKLILVGSVRDDQDEKRVYKFRLQAQELARDRVDFLVNAKWPQVLDLLKSSSVGVNAMWNEHFGIGVVEYQAAGLISVVHDSGGPKADIVVDIDGGETGLRCEGEEDFANAFEKVLVEMKEEERLAMRLRARESAARFSEGVFDGRWSGEIEGLVGMLSR